MIRGKAVEHNSQVPVVVLLIIALLMYALLGLGSTARNILQRPSVNVFRAPEGLPAAVQDAAIQIREIVKRQINQPSAIGPTFPRVDANPEAVRQTQLALRATELAPPVPGVVVEIAKSGKVPAAAKNEALRTNNLATAASSKLENTGKRASVLEGRAKKGRGQGGDSTKRPDKRN